MILDPKEQDSSFPNRVSDKVGSDARKLLLHTLLSLMFLRCSGLLPAAVRVSAAARLLHRGARQDGRVRRRQQQAHPRRGGSEQAQPRRRLPRLQRVSALVLRVKPPCDRGAEYLYNVKRLSRKNDGVGWVKEGTEVSWAVVLAFELLVKLGDQVF